MSKIVCDSHIDINPLTRIFDMFAYLAKGEIYKTRYIADGNYVPSATRYAHCVSADLYHIEFEQSENISYRAERQGFPETSITSFWGHSRATAYRQLTNRQKAIKQLFNSTY